MNELLFDVMQEYLPQIKFGLSRRRRRCRCLRRRRQQQGGPHLTKLKLLFRSSSLKHRMHDIQTKVNRVSVSNGEWSFFSHTTPSTASESLSGSLPKKGYHLLVVSSLNSKPL
jgi:hypothetical protein